MVRGLHWWISAYGVKPAQRREGPVSRAAQIVPLAVWARIELGGNWSGIMTVKEAHEMVQSGPYRMVRHPIYSTLVRGEWRGLVAFAIVSIALWRKLQLEERWLAEVFGSQYARYRATRAGR